MTADYLFNQLVDANLSIVPFRTNAQRPLGWTASPEIPTAVRAAATITPFAYILLLSLVVPVNSASFSQLHSSFLILQQTAGPGNQFKMVRFHAINVEGLVDALFSQFQSDGWLVGQHFSRLDGFANASSASSLINPYLMPVEVNSPPLKIISLARAAPISRGKRKVPPARKIPTISGRPTGPFLSAIRQSQASQFSPPPTKPEIAHLFGKSLICKHSEGKRPGLF